MVFPSYRSYYHRIPRNKKINVNININRNRTMQYNKKRFFVENSYFMKQQWLYNACQVRMLMRRLSWMWQRWKVVLELHLRYPTYTYIHMWRSWKVFFFSWYIKIGNINFLSWLHKKNLMKYFIFRNAYCFVTLPIFS